MTIKDLLSELSRRPLLCDGAMGTQLMARGLKSGEPGERWNLTRPGEVELVHRRYVDAGCRLITTNTFGGTSLALQRHGLADKARDINQAGARLAKNAAGIRALVLGDIGPFTGFMEPLGDVAERTVYDAFLAQAAALHSGGADGIIVETMSDPAELAVAVRAAREVADWPVFATYAFGKSDDSFRTMMGTDVPTAMKAAIDAGAHVVGANCGTSLSLEDYQRLAEQLVKAAGKTPVILQPNAGSPSISDEGQLRYGATPEVMARIVPGLLKTGLRVLGGCCGTSPEILKAMGSALEHVAAFDQD